MNRGAIILCGGRSVRMGRDKALLPFGGETLLARAVRIVAEVVPAERIVCVAAAGQELPAVDDRVRVVRDAIPNAGPLCGLATGLAAIGRDADAVFACGCDAPLLMPAFVSRLFERLGDHEIVIPREGDQLHPLAAVYRTSVLPQAESLLAAGKRSLLALVERCDARELPADEFRGIDPELVSLLGCNSDDEYRSLLGRIDNQS
jgi:molybdopterin-guanine dinucleotide biosynthesis protein A